MDRQVWLAGRWAAVVARYDAGAAAYGDDEYPWEMRGNGWPGCCA